MSSVVKKVMFVGRATVFMVGLAVILALTVGVAGAAFGANGGNFILGQTNAATAITKLAGAAGVAGPSLQIDNNSTNAAATALDLQVEAGKAPMKVNSGAQVANLNADKVDGKDANQLVRVASFGGQSPLANGTNGTVATTTINAPAPGFLVIDASSDVFNNGESDFPQCFIRVDGFLASGSRRIMQLNATQGGVNTHEDCSTNAVVPVAAGTHTVDLDGSVNAPNTSWGETALSAIYLPFNGSGASSASAALSAAQEEAQAPETRQ
jgi:hypothetical protein